MSVVSQNYGFTSLVGGGDGALDKLDGATILNTSMAKGVVAGIEYTYVFNSSSSAAESIPDIIAPNSGTGRWELKSTASGTNSGNETLVSIATLAHSATASDAIADADEFNYWVNSVTAIRKITYTNLKARILEAIGKTNETVGFTISGGATSKVMTVGDDASVSGTNTGDQTLTSLGLTSAGQSFVTTDITGEKALLGLGTAAYTASSCYATAAQGNLADNAVPQARTITTTSPLTIDGGASADLSANRTLAAAASSASVTGWATPAQITKLDGIEAGATVFTSTMARSAVVSDLAYNATSWDNVTEYSPSMNAVRDKIESMGASSGVSKAIHQDSHGFVVGDIIYLNSTTYTKAIATSAAAAEVVGIVSAVAAGTDDFTLSGGGYISGLTSLTAGAGYFLSPSSAGTMTATEPTTVGHISKPIFIADTTTSGYFFNMRGLIITAASSGGGGLTWTLITANPNPAVKDNGYLCNTTGGAFTVTLPPAPDEGDIVAVADAAGTFDTLNLTIGRNSLKIMGLEQDMTVSTKNAAFNLVYASAALGWRIA